MSWLDKILSHPEDHEEATEKVSLSKILDGDVAFGSGDGSIRAADASKIADLKVDIDPAKLEPKFSIRVPPAKWPELEVVCSGNAAEVQTEPMSDGRYRVKRKLAAFKPAWVEEEEVLELPEFGSTKDFLTWIESLDNDGIEALRQIYYDRWTFDTGNQRDRMYYELLEEEKSGRK